MARIQRKKRKSRAKGDGEVDDLLVRALGHPVRASALRILNERVASAKLISRELHVPLGVVAYHVRILEEFDLIELVEEIPRRGATEYLFRGTVRSFLNDQNWAKLGADEKNGISIAGLKMINDAARAALIADLFDSRANRHLSCTPVRVDESGWRALMDLLNDTLDQILSIQGESNERLAAEGGDGIRATISLLGFESPRPES